MTLLIILGPILLALGGIIVFWVIFDTRAGIYVRRGGSWMLLGVAFIILGFIMLAVYGEKEHQKFVNECNARNGVLINNEKSCVDVAPREILQEN